MKGQEHILVLSPSFAILLVTIFFNRSINKIEASRRDEEIRNGVHQRNQIRSTYLKKLLLHLEELETFEDTLKRNFLGNAHGGLEVGASMEFDEIFNEALESEEKNSVKNISKKINDKLLNEKLQKDQDYRDAESKLLGIHKNLYKLRSEIYKNTLIDLGLETPILSETYYPYLNEAKSRALEKKSVRGLYIYDFIDTYINCIKLKQAHLNLKNQIENEVEDDPSNQPKKSITTGRFFEKKNKKGDSK